MEAGIRTQGFTLVEVTLAIGVVGFALIAVFGLLPVGIQSSQTAIEQTTVNGILSSVVTDLRSTPRESGVSERYKITIPNDPTSGQVEQVLFFDGDGQWGTSVGLNSRYRMGVTFLPADHANGATRVALKMTWPAGAEPENATGSVRSFTAFIRR